MAMQTMDKTANAETTAKQPVPIAWRLTIAAGAITGAVFALMMLFAPQMIKLLAGIAPVLAGSYVGRKVKGRALVHGMLLTLFAFLVAAAIAVPVVYGASPESLKAMFPVDPANPDTPVTPEGALITLGFSAILMLLLFPTYGVVLSLRNQRREQDYRQEIERRGGQLQRPGRVITVEDLQDLPLPKFASWAAQLFKRNGFTLDDYKFNKEGIDLYLKRAEPEERWVVRCTTDEIKPGMALALDQDMRDAEWVKGVIVSSAKLSEATRKTLRRNPRIEAIDGDTLIEIA